MEYRKLVDGDLIQNGDEYSVKESWFYFDRFQITDEFDSIRYDAGRRKLPAATFEESANFEPIHVSQEEVIYPKADVFGDKDKAIASALELFKGMDRIIPPTINQLGVLYDNGLLNITK